MNDRGRLVNILFLNLEEILGGDLVGNRLWLFWKWFGEVGYVFENRGIIKCFLREELSDNSYISRIEILWYYVIGEIVEVEVEIVEIEGFLGRRFRNFIREYVLA